ncbi:MAG: hypothetical protein ACF8QF_00770, partial [Phycisphaerales bacterium]
LREGEPVGQAYAVIEAEKANFPVAMMCRCLDVSPSGYYAQRNAAPSTRAKENEVLKQEIKAVLLMGSENRRNLNGWSPCEPRETRWE